MLSIDKLKFLVVGTGRCGTVYLAKFLTSLGIPCGHEAIFKNDGLPPALERLSGQKPIEVSAISKRVAIRDEQDGVFWLKRDDCVVGDSSYMAAPFIDHPLLKNTKIIHVIRQPMKVINSFVEGFKYFNDWCFDGSDRPYHEFIYQYVPRLHEKLDVVSRAALYYIKWNEMIEEKSKNRSYFLYRIEHSPEKLFNFLGVPFTDNYYKNTKANHQPTSNIYNNLDCVKNAEIKDRLIGIMQRYYLDILMS